MADYRFWSKKIVHILNLYNQTKGTHLFGITGDIDNLGIYVSQNGRAKAENLVESYNHIIGMYVQKMSAIVHTSILDIVFIPSGEEVLILGIVNDASFIETLRTTFAEDINSLIAAHSPLKDESVTVTFGVSDLSYVVNSDDLAELLKNISSENLSEANRIYLKIMEAIREDLGRHLDEMKFASLAQGTEYSVFFRNTIYHQMLDYKKRTKKLLRHFDSKLNQEGGPLVRKSETINTQQGLTQNNLQTIDQMVQKYHLDPQKDSPKA